MRLETTILKNLIQNEEYTRKVLPFLKEDYFKEHTDKIIFNLVDQFVNKYNSLPSNEALTIELEELSVREDEYRNALELLEEVKLDTGEYTDVNWLLDSTEKFCQDKAIYNAVVESISILDNPNTKYLIPISLI